MSRARAIVGALLLAGCADYPEVAIDLDPGQTSDEGALSVCAAPSDTVTMGCDLVAGAMNLENFGTATGTRNARFVFDRSTPDVVRVDTARGWAEFRLTAGEVLRIAASVRGDRPNAAIALDCSNPAYVCGSGSLAVCRAPPAQCP